MTTHYKGWMKKLLEVEFDKLRKGQLAKEAAWSLRRLWEGMREAALKGDFYWCWSDKEQFKFEFKMGELCVFTTSHISPNPQGEAQIFIRREGGEEHILPEWQAGVESYQPNKVYELLIDYKGKRYSAKTFLPLPTPLQSVSFVPTTENPLYGELKAILSDPPVQTDYYKLETRRIDIFQGSVIDEIFKRARRSYFRDRYIS